MTNKTKTNALIIDCWKFLQGELLFWARLSLETKFAVALALLVVSFLTGSLAPILSSTLNVWGMMVFFEALIQKNLKWEKWDGRNILRTYLIAGIAGTVIASFLLLYFDTVYFIKLSLLDFLTRYIWFLLPISKIRNYLPPKNKE